MVSRDELGKMNKGTRTRGWIAFCVTGLILLIIIVSLLAISRSQLHTQVIESEVITLQTAFNKILNEEILNSLTDDLNLSTGKLTPNAIFLNPQKVIEQAAMQSLRIPQVFGMQAYSELGKPVDLPTSLDLSVLKAEMISDITKNGWSFRWVNEETWAISFRPQELEGDYILEFQLLISPLYASWERIDQTLLKQGALLGLAALILLAFVYQNLINKILAKESLLEERSHILEETNRKLSQAYKSAGLGAMTGHLLHGLKTPLTSLKSISSNLYRDENKLADSTLRKNVENIQNQVSRALTSIRELEEDKISYTLTLGEFSQLVEARFSSEYPSAKLEIKGNERDDIFLDNLQSHLTLAILSNLFQNSSEARRDVSVKINFSKTGNQLALKISDNGGGIPLKTADLLFKPLISRKKGGTGIGLALSSQLAESMEGSLELTGNKPKGVCFTLTLPIHSMKTQK